MTFTLPPETSDSITLRLGRHLCFGEDNFWNWNETKMLEIKHGSFPMFSLCIMLTAVPIENDLRVENLFILIF